MKLSLLILLLSLTTTISAQDYQGRLYNFGLQVLGAVTPEGEILSTGKSLLSEALVAKDDFNAGEVLALVGLHYLQKGNNGQADQVLTQAEQYAISATSKPTSENLRLLVEIRTRFMITKGFPYILGNAGGIEETAKKSLALNPGNQRSALIVAFGKINAPAAFGGDPDLAIKMITPIANAPQSVVVKWISAMGLAQAYDKKGDRAQARAWVKIAGDLFPGNPDTKKLAGRLQG